MAKVKKRKLRFAALCRVSTDRQEKKTSLKVQRKKIQEAVRKLKGEVVEWYGGSEHATPGYEKKEINRLLADAEQGKFDAVMVSHVDRWSRDNAASQKGVDILFDNDIRFFVLTTEHDLGRADAKLFLRFQAIIGEYVAEITKGKSLDSKIEMAQNNAPGCGRLPYGRTYDHKTKSWGVDEKAKAKINKIANRYLAGEKLSDLADEYKMSQSGLHKILTQRCGGVWVQVFTKNKGKRNEEITTVETEVPRLLPEATIEAIKKKCKANLTYNHGDKQNRYLLRQKIFCNQCDSILFGQTDKRNPKNIRRTYRHLKNTPASKECCDSLPSRVINADVIEENVIFLKTIIPSRKATREFHRETEAKK